MPAKKKTKARKTSTASYAGRLRAPMANRASVNEGTFTQLIAHRAPEVKAIAKKLRSIVMDVLPTAEEVTYLGWNVTLFRDRKEICSIAPMKQRCNFFLAMGARVSDPDKLLQGTGTKIRHMQITSVSDIPVARLKKMIKEGKALAKPPGRAASLRKKK